MIVYIYHANAILSYPIKNRSTGKLLCVFHHVYAKLHATSFKPQLHKLDNEFSTVLETFITNDNTALQYMSPEIHQANAAECTIQTWKSHFKVGLASLPKQILISHLCQLTTQCDITLNML